MDKNKTQQRQPVRIVEAINTSLEQAARSQGPALGIPSGFPSLDRLTRGWNEGDLVVIGGRPGTGTTALALGMARNAAVDFGVPTAFFSLESTVMEMTDRLIVSESGIPMEKLHGERAMQDIDWQRMEASLKRLSEAPLYLDDTTPGLPPEYRITEFQSQAEPLAKDREVKLFIVDNLQATIPDWTGWEPDCLAHECRKTLHFLKRTAESLGAAIIVLTSLGRPVGKGIPWPTLKDLDPYCPDAEDFADKIILLHQPLLPDFCKETDDKAKELLIASVDLNRKGRTGSACLSFDQERIRVENPEEGRLAAVHFPFSDTSEPGTF